MNQASDDPIMEVTSALEVVPWHYIIVADGSGSKWGYAAGWGAAVVAAHEQTVRWMSGSLSDATVNVAEIMALMHPLVWCHATIMRRRKERGLTEPERVHLVTDSDYVARTLQAKDLSPLTQTHPVLWTTFAMVRRMGIRIYTHKIERNTLQLHLEADRLSKKARKSIQNVGAEDGGDEDIDAAQEE